MKEIWKKNLTCGLHLRIKVGNISKFCENKLTSKPSLAFCGSTIFWLDIVNFAFQNVSSFGFAVDISVIETISPTCNVFVYSCSLARPNLKDTRNRSWELSVGSKSFVTTAAAIAGTLIEVSSAGSKWPPRLSIWNKNNNENILYVFHTATCSSLWFSVRTTSFQKRKEFDIKDFRITFYLF